MPGRAPARVAAADLSDLLLILLTFSSGAVDAITFLGLGRVFTANMTGNIVLLGVAVGSGAGSEVIRAAVSLTAFMVGVFAASQISGRHVTPRSWSPGVKIVLGFEVLAQSAFLAGWLASSAHPGVTLEAVLVGLSALAMGSQTGAVTALGIIGISTTFVTGTLTRLIGGLATSTGSRRDRGRQALVLFALLAGAACAGLLMLDERRIAPALPPLISLLVLATAVYVLPTASDPNPRDLSPGD